MTVDFCVDGDRCTHHLWGRMTYCICGDPHPHVHTGSNYGPGRVEHLDDWPWFVKQGKPPPDRGATPATPYTWAGVHP